MKLREQIAYQRAQFLRKGYEAPNRLLVPVGLKHQLLGELIDHYRPTHFVPDRIVVMGMRVSVTADCSRLEVSLCLE